MVKDLLILVIKLYRAGISPLLPASCRFYPTCSDYAIQAIGMYGIFKGVAMAIKRLLKCNQLSAGGYDPVLRGK